MGKFQFLEAAAIGAVPQPGSIKSPGCLACLEGFRVNMQVALTGTTVPAFAMWMGMEWTASGTMAAQGSLHPGLSKSKKKEIAQMVGPLAQRYMRLAVRTTRDEQLALLVENTTMFEKFSDDAGPYAQEVIHNLLRGIIVQSWTAFESLSEELYKAANKEAKATLPWPLDKKKKNLVKPRFRSRDGIRYAYNNEDGSKIIQPLHDSSINALALLRNAIVHKAARADCEFTDGAKNTPLLVRYAGLVEPDPIMLDGAIVRSIVTPVIQNAHAMIEAVDVWLKTH